MKRLAQFVFLASLLFALTIPVVYAAGPAGGGNPVAPAGGGNPVSTDSDGGGLTNPLNNINSLPDFMNAILDAVVTIGSIILTLAIVYVGFLFVQAQGNDEKIKSARSALMWTVIGGLVLLGARTVGLVITSTIGAL